MLHNNSNFHFVSVRLMTRTHNIQGFSPTYLTIHYHATLLYNHLAQKCMLPSAYPKNCNLQYITEIFFFHCQSRYFEVVVSATNLSRKFCVLIVQNIDHYLRHHVHICLLQLTILLPMKVPRCV